MGLPLDTGCNAVYTYIDKLTKLVNISPCVAGDGGLLAPATAKLFFNHVFWSYGVPYIVLHERHFRFTSGFLTALFVLSLGIRPDSIMSTLVRFDETRPQVTLSQICMGKNRRNLAHKTLNMIYNITIRNKTFNS